MRRQLSRDYHHAGVRGGLTGTEQTIRRARTIKLGGWRSRSTGLLRVSRKRTLGILIAAANVVADMHSARQVLDPSQGNFKALTPRLQPLLLLQQRRQVTGAISGEGVLVELNSLLQLSNVDSLSLAVITLRLAVSSPLPGPANLLLVGRINGINGVSSFKRSFPGGSPR